MKPELIGVLLETFCKEIVDDDGQLLLATDQVERMMRNRRSNASHPRPAMDMDPIAIEATMNKRYVTDLVGHAIDADSREELKVCGRAIMRVWAERIALRYPDREVLFYLGGADSTILRFHVRREGLGDWLNLSQSDFLAGEHMEVYLLRGGDLAQLFPDVANLRE